MKFSGIDLHSNNCFVVIIDEADRIMYGRRLPNKLSGILAALAPYRDELDGVVVESTYNWYWLVDGLMAAGYPVHLANTAAIKKYDGLKHSGDEADAVHLAHLLRLGILPTGHTSADVVLLAATDTLHGTLLGTVYQEAHGARLPPLYRCPL